jgi:uncharacterized protein YprB with RNaseH-like and TPR domain
MIESTFVFLKGIGLITERKWWTHGVRTWGDFVAAERVPGLSIPRKLLCDEEVQTARERHRQEDARFFARCLRRRDHWRLYEWLRSRAVYLDIETTAGGEVSVVGLYGNGRMTRLVRGDSLSARRLDDELARYDLLVTFNGAGFDLPCLRANFPRLALEHPHMDLCLLGRQLGLRGGLKQIETLMGIERETALQGMDGWDAVRLWNRWRQRRDATALDLLLAYNEADCRNLVPLADQLYCSMVQQHEPAPSQSSLAQKTKMVCPPSLGSSGELRNTPKL